MSPAFSSRRCETPIAAGRNACGAAGKFSFPQAPPVSREVRPGKSIPPTRLAAPPDNKPSIGFAELNAVAVGASYPGSAVVFGEGALCAGLYILCQGKLKLFVSSKAGKNLIMHIAHAGDILNPSAAFSSEAHQASAQTLCPSQLAFIPRKALLRLLAQRPAIHSYLLGQLNAQYRSVCDKIRTIGLVPSAQRRLANFLSEWSVNNGNGGPVTIELSHEEIAECLGTTRETVTRILGEFKSSGLLEIGHSILTIRRPADLESLIDAPDRFRR